MLADRTVAVIGYGSERHAHDNNLRTAASEGVVGLRPEHLVEEVGGRLRAMMIFLGDDTAAK